MSKTLWVSSKLLGHVGEAVDLQRAILWIAELELDKEKGPPLPKFGEWDVNDPASAEGFTVIFNKARDEKKTGGNTESPGKTTTEPQSKPASDPGKPQSDVKFNEAEFPFSKLFATSFDHKVIDTHTNHTNVPFFLPTSNSKLLSKGPTEQLHQLTNKPNDPPNIDKPVSPPPSLTPQPSPTHTLSTGHSNDPSHVSNSF
ncbi:hypothetical protein KIW84_054706 [Lathyrus oleraceus]|uniref:RIN4 pathogenic type III effector avirulence factor Avr cleavage site domain-containing protein n=1 Tax=Pisum sativum TaxID=3888 RepID=A0A9D4WW30_PEA|nr:hypothetical protein KIW84_054706 [Pisum sativum]